MPPITAPLIASVLPSVVLLGFGMNLAVVPHTGSRGLVFAAGTITATFALGYLPAKLLRIGPTTSTLISAGTAICGGRLRHRRR